MRPLFTTVKAAAVAAALFLVPALGAGEARAQGHEVINLPDTKFSSAAWKDIWVQIGRSSLAKARTSPAKKAALAMVSTTVGPAGSTRFSTRKCGLSPLTS